MLHDDGGIDRCSLPVQAVGRDQLDVGSGRGQLRKVSVESVGRKEKQPGVAILERGQK